MKQKIAKQKDVKSQSGITLIALVITIIVLLILAGISINLVLGENGVLAKAKYASFVNEMTAVEEKLNIWKTGEVIDVNYTKPQTKIPTAGLYGVSELEKTTRLAGEVGYYRVWDINETKPDMDINSSASIFNNAFESELIYYPAGVQDLYYLDNDELGITGSKKYLIDASNGMVYSTVGTNINGIQCYSLNMAKMAMGGYNEKPAFAAAEVSGSAGNLAGNVSSKYLVDENGNYILDENGNKIENPDYNPYWFEIIGHKTNPNIYKLYNNGDLYGKGVKGTLLGNTEAEMESLNTNKWKNFEIPNEIPGDDTNRIISPGYNSMFIIDSNKDLWAWGDNSYNKLGLTKNEQQEYIAVKPTKLNVNNKKISKVFSLSNNTFVLTTDNELYATGSNSNGQLGIGYLSDNEENFVKVNFDNPNSIVTITGNSSYQNGIVILTKDGDTTSLYYAGITSVTNRYENVVNNNVTTFNKIYDGNRGDNIENAIVNAVSVENNYVYVLDEKGLLYRIIPYNLSISNITIGDTTGGVESIRGIERAIVATKVIDGQRHLYYMEYDLPWGPHALLNSDITEATGQFEEFDSNITKNMDLNEIKDIFVMNRSQLFILMNNGDVYAKGKNSCFGEGIASNNTPNEFRKIQDYTSDLPKIDSFCVNKGSTLYADFSYGLLKGKDGKYYGIGNADIIFGEKKFQKSWKLIAQNVKKFDAATNGNALAYIDNNNDIWVVGNSASMLGCNTNGNDYEIKEFTRLKDKLNGLSIYNNISGNVQDYGIIDGGLYIKTTATDNNTLYVSGFCKDGTRNRCIGVTTDAYIPTKILDNVEQSFLNEYTGHGAITNVNGTKKMYLWGNNNWSCIGGYESEVPKEVTISDLNLEGANIFIQTQMGIIGQADKTMYLSGGVTHSGSLTVVNGVDRYYFGFVKLTIKEYLNSSESLSIRKIVSNNGLGNNLYQMEDYSLYGLGDQSKLGIGVTDTTYLKTPKKIETPETFVDIAAGENFYIGITEDGKVYATGSNINGILGRWIGVDRKTPNSRYKTAFDWVECPELEI